MENLKEMWVPQTLLLSLPPNHWIDHSPIIIMFYHRQQSIYIYMYVYTYVCVYIYMYMYMYIYTYAYISQDIRISLLEVPGISVAQPTTC